MVQEQKAEFWLQDYTGSQLQSGVTNRDGSERGENKAGMEKEQIQAHNRASEALARFPAALWPYQHTRGTQHAHSSVETAH